MPQKHKIRHAGPNKPQLCGGKHCYTTKRDAEMVIAEKEIIQPELQLTIYHCIQCGTYHLTRVTT
ncbi:MAG: hypothetical protein WAW60_00085 [Candidatus Saccharimonadales bacterium]